MKQKDIMLNKDGGGEGSDQFWCWLMGSAGVVWELGSGQFGFWRQRSMGSSGFFSGSVVFSGGLGLGFFCLLGV